MRRPASECVRVHLHTLCAQTVRGGAHGPADGRTRRDPTPAPTPTPSCRVCDQSSAGPRTVCWQCTRYTLAASLALHCLLAVYPVNTRRFLLNLIRRLV